MFTPAQKPRGLASMIFIAEIRSSFTGVNAPNRMRSRRGWEGDCRVGPSPPTTHHSPPGAACHDGVMHQAACLLEPRRAALLHSWWPIRGAGPRGDVDPMSAQE